ncbi:hypothetical protein FOZ63_023763, partial [Perkinsus olseni]
RSNWLINLIPLLRQLLLLRTPRLQTAAAATVMQLLLLLRLLLPSRPVSTLVMWRRRLVRLVLQQQQQLRGPVPVRSLPSHHPSRQLPLVWLQRALRLTRPKDLLVRPLVG